MIKSFQPDPIILQPSMPSSDYTSAVGGGLKLKGSAKDAGVAKKKKKRDKPKAETSDDASRVIDNNDEKKATGNGAKDGKQEDGREEEALQKALADEERAAAGKDEVVTEQDVRDLGKTEAQRRFEERRRKRLDERLKKDGIKTHKQRVEELNKYLSGLSEHHDMPRIGPG